MTSATLPQHGVVHSAGSFELEGESQTRSGVSWGAIFAGAAGAAALSLILLILGTGLGLSSVSPWTGRGAGATTMGISTIVWLTITQLAASGMGGYLAGRLRTKWVAVHSDEVYFRDTAHGFLAWAVATLVTAATLTSAIGSVVGAGAQVGASVAGGVVSTATTGAVAAGAVAAKDDTSGANGNSGMGYFVDSLFRKAPNAASATLGASANPATSVLTEDGNPQAMGAEVTRIFANAVRSGTLGPEDVRYVGQLVAQRTDMSQADAEKRVNDSFTAIQTNLKQAETAAREAADKARKASAGAALWLFVSLLIGAFVASLAATFGGRQRDAF
ncbi:MAG: hypothetical protein ABIN96_16830 [Rubrivivax sp.]